MRKFDRPNYRKVTVTKKGKSTIQEEWAISKFDVMFYSLYGAILAKAVEERLQGGSLYTFLKDEIKAILEFLRSELVKTADSAGAAGGTFATGLGEGVGAAFKGMGEGIGDALAGVGRGLGEAVAEALGGITDPLEELLRLPSWVTSLLSKFGIKADSPVNSIISTLTALLAIYMKDPVTHAGNIADITRLLNYLKDNVKSVR